MEIWKNINWKKLMKRLIIGVITLSIAFAQIPEYLNNKIDQMADQLERQVIEWRRDFHENPELSNREFRTAEKVANHLRSLGIDVKTGVAHTGVVGLLKGGKPGKVVALRADMDGLPVKEKVDLPFASKRKVFTRIKKWM
jgi:amidohydrolase